MKGGVAAMMAAAARTLRDCGGQPAGSISFLITLDEEGPAVHGTRAVVDWMRQKGERPDHCLLGEPTHSKRMGEAIKIGRRGSLTGRLTVRGVQGHVAYPDMTRNPLTGLVRPACTRGADARRRPRRSSATSSPRASACSDAITPRR
jgi:succinyl-diaminopimelate desuccinylase